MDEENQSTMEQSKESTENNENPGPIDISELLDENLVDYFVDPDVTKDYCNYVLKAGL